MLKISQIRCTAGETLSRGHIAVRLHCRPDDILSFEIERESLDARRAELYFSYTVLAEVRNEEKYLRRKDVSEGRKHVYHALKAERTPAQRPVVAGFGPSGMFAGLILAESGLKPLIIERGKPVEERSRDIEQYFRDGVPDPDSNVQYGEGGAGTFSDGKLTTRIKDERIHKVLGELIEAGADPAIAYQARPHLGTDRLQVIVRKIREKIISLGGEVRFETRMDDIEVQNGKLQAVITNRSRIPADACILCLGHSASETYEMLQEKGIRIIPKDFAAGVRVEHPQELIDRCQYGDYAGHPALSAASYSLAFRSSCGRGVYSFCMCPGGIVIPAATAAESLAVNGMSYSQRDGRNANSAILVQIPKEDFFRGNAMDGFAFQKELEKRAWQTGAMAPSQNIQDYLKHQKTKQFAAESTYPLGTVSFDMHSLFSEEAGNAMEEGFENFDRKIPGFISAGIMVGMESRSSSPIRVIRTDTGESESLNGLFPCGEGAGYAGGIVSSAVDGIRQAENLIRFINGSVR